MRNWIDSALDRDYWRDLANAALNLRAPLAMGLVHSLYSSPYVVRAIMSRRLRWAGHVARMEEGRSAFKILTGTPAGPLGRPRRRWEDTIGMDL